MGREKEWGRRDHIYVRAGEKKREFGRGRYKSLGHARELGWGEAPEGVQEQFHLRHMDPEVATPKVAGLPVEI